MVLSKNHYHNLLATYLKPQWRCVLLLTLLLLGGIGLELINPQILGHFIDTATTGGSQQVLLKMTLLFLSVALVTQLVAIGRGYLASNVGLTATNALRADLTWHCLQLGPAFHHVHTPGELIERVDGDTANLSNLFSEFFIQILGNLLLLLAVLFLSFQIDWRVGLGLTGFALMALLILYRLRDVAVPAQGEVRQADAEMFGFLEERLSGVEDIRTSGAIAYTLGQFHGRARTLLEKSRCASLLVGASFGTINILLTIGVALALALSAYLFQTGVITIGTIYLIFAYTELLRRPLEEVTRQVSGLQQATASLLRIGDLFNQQRQVKDGPGVTLPSGAPAIAFESVSFGYQADQRVLHDLSFEIPAGATLGLLGRTGSGKTTLTRLLFRLYDPLQGSVRLGGCDLRAFHLADLRRRIGLVPQDVQLFHATVRENLTLFDATITDLQIEQVLAELGLAEWYGRLPNGLQTLLAPDGTSLSAGEAQLLAFARVFLQNPAVVILDEASSRLDSATERLIDQAIVRLLQGRTALIIAHRLATVQRVDTIMILEQGRISEFGQRAALAADPASRFAHLLQRGLTEVLT